MIQGNIKKYKDCNFLRLLTLYQRYIRTQERKLYRWNYHRDELARDRVEILWIRIVNVVGALKKQYELYNELIYAVGNKYPDETRHQTALRYIKEAEQVKGHEVQLGTIKHVTIL